MASPGIQNYEVIYNVGLLDDIHNYFPSLLYDTGRFQSVSQVLHYTRNQMAEHFNLFSYGARRAAQVQAESQAQAQAQVPLQPQMRSRVVPSPLIQPNTTPIRQRRTNITSVFPSTMSLLFPQENTISEIQNVANFLDLLGVGITLPPPMESVVVRPTQAEITQATEILSGASLIENTLCSICQDTIINNDVVVRINACNHMYHRTCINAWFERSVRCPACRHDIREPVTTQAQGQGQVQAESPSPLT